MRHTLGKMLAAGAALALIAGCTSEGGDANAADGNAVAAGEPAEVGGATMDPNATIAANIGETDNLTRFLAAIGSAGLSETLEGAGPYTVFIPFDDAFAALPEGTIEGLSENARPELVNILSYHIVPGVITTEDLGAAIDRAENGEVVLATMTGATLTALRDGEAIVVRDGAGGVARLTTPDLVQSNGVVHIVDLVLNPGGGEEGEAAPAGNETAPAPTG